MMVNPAIQMLNKLRPLQNNNLVNLLQNSKNPQLFMQTMINQNPQIMGLINQYGNGDPQTAFYEYARIMGVDPNQILSMLENYK